MRQREVRLRRDKTGDAMDQASWRSSFLDDPGTKFLCGKQGRSTKKETSSKKPGGLWKLTPRWKSAKNADFHRGLKSLANDARLFHSSHRPNNHHQLKTLTLPPSGINLLQQKTGLAGVDSPGGWSQIKRSKEAKSS